MYVRNTTAKSIEDTGDAGTGAGFELVPALALPQCFMFALSLASSRVSYRATQDVLVSSGNL